MEKCFIELKCTEKVECYYGFDGGRGKRAAGQENEDVNPWKAEQPQGQEMWEKKCGGPTQTHFRVCWEVVPPGETAWGFMLGELALPVDNLEVLGTFPMLCPPVSGL